MKYKNNKYKALLNKHSFMYKSVLVFVISVIFITVCIAFLSCAVNNLWLTYAVFAVFAAVIIGLFMLIHKYTVCTLDEYYNKISEDIHETEKKNISENTHHSQDYNPYEYNFFVNAHAELLHKLLVGTFTYSPEELQEHGINFPYRYFGVAMTRLDHLKNLDPTETPLIKYGIVNIGNEVFSTGMKAYGTEVNEYDIVWIVNYESTADVLSSIEQIKLFISDIYHCTASFGCDYDAQMPDDISDMYKNAKYALSYRLTRGYNSTIIYKELGNINPLCEYPENFENIICTDITSQDKTALKHDIKKFISAINSAPYTIILTHTNRLLYTVDRLNLADTDDEGSVSTNHMEIMTRMETIDEIGQYIITRCESIMLKFSSAKTDSKKDAIANAIAEFIDANFTDSNLSIDTIANEVDRSANYTRSIFKQSRGISISDYITKKRFDEVCRLLLSTDLPAQEIGRQTGLNSGSYFYTAFKKHTGCTPDQYRKEHTSQNIE